MKAAPLDEFLAATGLQPIVPIGPVNFRAEYPHVTIITPVGLIIGVHRSVCDHDNALLGDCIDCECHEWAGRA